MQTKRDPIHPGEVLFEDFLQPLGVSQNRLAIAIGVDIARINNIVKGRRSITPDTALRLGRYLNTGPEVWLNLQQEYDLRIARRRIAKVLKRIEPVRPIENVSA
jgi:addiction module HigA family antidote